MNLDNRHDITSRDDRMLEWTMRTVGFALAALSLVFLTQDIVQGANATYFFSISAGLGIITLIMSWMPQSREARPRGRYIT